MKNVLANAVIEGIVDELKKERYFYEVVSTHSPHSGLLEIVYTEAMYELSVSILDDAVLRYDCSRYPRHRIVEELLDLCDPNVFQAVSRRVSVCTRMDNRLVRVLDRVGHRILETAQSQLRLPDGWRVVFSNPRVSHRSVTVVLRVTPALLQHMFPDVCYEIVLEADRFGKFAVSTNTRGICATAKRKTLATRGCEDIVDKSFLQFPTPHEFAQQTWTSRDLPALYTRWIELLEQNLWERFLSVEAESLSARARQAILVLTPVRLAATARERGEIQWNRDVVSDALQQLSSEPPNARSLIWQLFFQLLEVELAPVNGQESAYRDYERLGLELAELRSHHPSVPFNPVLAYAQYRRQKADVGDKLNDDEQQKCAWFLHHASLEDIVELMSSPRRASIL